MRMTMSSAVMIWMSFIISNEEDHVVCRHDLVVVHHLFESGADLSVGEGLDAGAAVLLAFARHVRLLLHRLHR